jgi:two-component system response regulator
MNNKFEILLVEDNPQDAELAIRALRECLPVSHLAHVCDGREALDFLHGSAAEEGCKPPKVVLLDLKLPKVSGLEVLREIRANERTKLLPVVVLTSSREDSDVAEAYRLGANSFIVKPVDFENFLEVVSHMGSYWINLNQSPLIKL